MDNTALSYPEPLKPVEQWDVHDSTKANAFMTCPRRYFFEYVLGWRTNMISYHLGFGIAWHAGMEAAYRNIDKDPAERLALAQAAFTDSFKEELGATDQYADRAPKDYGNGMLALKEYLRKHKNESENGYKTLHTEVSGAVPISEDTSIHFKFDALMEGPHGPFVLEHKTTGADRSAWRQQFEQAFQISCYNYALLGIVPGDNNGVVINGAIFRKMGNAFVRIPVKRTILQLEEWMYQADLLLRTISHNFQALSECTLEAGYMAAFPKNTTACTMFNMICPYFASCSNWTNPLQRCEDPPANFTVRHWDPRAIEDKEEVPTDD